MWTDHSVGLEDGELLGRPEGLEEEGPALEVGEGVLDARQEDLLQAVLLKVLVGQDAEGLVERVALPRPEQLEVAETLHHVLQLGAHPLEIGILDGQFLEDPAPEFAAAADEGEDGLREVSDQVFVVVLPLEAELRLLALALRFGGEQRAPPRWPLSKGAFGEWVCLLPLFMTTVPVLAQPHSPPAPLPLLPLFLDQLADLLQNAVLPFLGQLLLEAPVLLHLLEESVVEVQGRDDLVLQQDDIVGVAREGD